ncbi:MAG: MaoC/PaaZ C-terminal domain-containing protein [Polyangiales bacterium]
MTLDMSFVGQRIDPLEFTYAAKDAIRYALGVGAKAAELNFLYEGRGPKVIPSFAVIPAYEALVSAMARSGIGFDKVVHGHQKITMRRPLSPEATLRSTAVIEGIYDLKKMAQAVVSTRTEDAATGEHLFDTEWGIIIFGEGGFGGAPPPPRETSTPTRPCDVELDQATSPEQALLYRLMGDGNPLHADPDFPLVQERFGGRPILHGLCSYGFLARAVAQAFCDGDATRVRHLAARFTKPVFPGDTLRTELWRDGAKVWARVTTRERGEPCLSQCYAEID